MQTINYRQYQPFFTKRVIMASPQGAWCSYPHYPARPQPGCMVEDLPNLFGWERSPHSKLAGGSVLRAYRRARGRVCYARAYLGQYFVMFAGPRGLLP